MIWNHEQFVREVRRQLIELESLRKKIQTNSDVRESLERLFESNRQLLRKLSEYFHAQMNDSLINGSTATVPEYLLAYLQSILQQPTVLKHLAGNATDDGGGESSSWLVLAVAGGVEAPLLKEKCPHCGKLLVSSILAGAAVVQKGESWFHKNCADSGERYWRPYSLN